MLINEVVLETAELDAVRAFYSATLGLEADSPARAALAFRAGATRLAFVPSSDPAARPAYHVAFNVPENQFAPAKAWISARAPLVLANGRDEFRFDDWNADALYFRDPAGNLLELIARHTLENASDRPFDARSILEASEIGIVVDDVPSAAGALRLAFGLSNYGSCDRRFAAVGDERGLFIVVERGRPWAPDHVRPAEIHATRVAIASVAGDAARFVLPGHPVFVTVAAAAR